MSVTRLYHRKIHGFGNQQSHRELHRYPAGTGCKVPVWGPAGGPPAAGGIALGGYFMCQQLQAQSLTAGRKKEMSV